MKDDDEEFTDAKAERDPTAAAADQDFQARTPEMQESTNAGS
jgi:hypothetical protein